MQSLPQRFLFRLIFEIEPTIEVIIITGYDSTETVIEALEHDVYAYLLKSEAMDNIYAVRNKVDNALAKQQAVREKLDLMEKLWNRNEELKQALDEAKTLQAELVQSQISRNRNRCGRDCKNLKSASRILSLSEAILTKLTLGPPMDTQMKYRILP